MKKFILTAFLASSAVAATSNDANAYGAAGCGLGGMILGDADGFMQIFAYTLNGISGNQTFGITFGTLGCDVGSGGSASLFIEANREAVVKEIARGNGESIDTLARMGGCASASAVGTYLQSEYNTIIPTSDTTDQEVGVKIVSILQDNEQLACTALQPTG